MQCIIDKNCEIMHTHLRYALMKCLCSMFRFTSMHTLCTIAYNYIYTNITRQMPHKLYAQMHTTCSCDTYNYFFGIIHNNIIAEPGRKGYIPAIK